MADERKMEAAYNEIVHILPDLEAFAKICKTSKPYYFKIVEFQELVDRLNSVRSVTDEITKHMDHG